MAAASSSSGGHCEYDVFLSFRGEDTRKSFVCHLYKALEQKAIRTFIDSEGLRKGNKISELLTAIEGSRISIVVLSQNYASSTWCLKELVKILDCMDNKQQIVVPVFYEVDPSDIRKSNNMFGEALAKHEGNPNLDKEEVKRWRTALSRITDLSGWDSRQYQDDIELIEKIVGDIIEKWIHTTRPSSLPNNLVGMDHHIKEVTLRLCRGKNDVGVVGIWGMGGLGKTTIARAVYDKIKYQFEHKCFFYNVKERFTMKKDEAQMRGELLSMILKGNEQGVDIFNEGSSLILERLGKKRVLVVLDDVETSSQIGALLGNYYSFGDGSRILITTRDKEALAGVIETYKPWCLNHNESLELFMKHAFGVNQPSEEYSGLSERAIEYAQGLPLALEVLGSSLFKKSINQWKNLLEKIKKIPNRKILDVLKTSFEGLDESEKNIFLDIACLFNGWQEGFVRELLQSFGFFPDIGLKILVDRALITISYGELNMHDLLQEMGRDIVRLESTKEPGRRSRLWSHEDVIHILTQNTATDAVECLMLDLSNSKVDLYLNKEAFVRMMKLRLLVIHYSHHSIFDPALWWFLGHLRAPHFRQCHMHFETDIPEYGCKQVMKGDLDLEFLSHELMFLLWHRCPLKSLPSNFIPKNLVRIDMRRSHIRELWKGMQPLQNLKVIVLSHCRYLVKIPDLTEAINLEELFLNGCSSLCELHSSISALQNLHYLTLRGCKELMILPEISGIMKELSHLCLDGTAIKGLPSSIELLEGLEILTMRDCKSLEFLPRSICNLTNLKRVDLSGCSALHNRPEALESGINPFPLYILLFNEQLEKLSDMVAPFSSWVTYIKFYGFSRLVHLDLSDCNLLELSDRIAHMSSLKTLKLCRNNLESLPVTMDRLGCLVCLSSIIHLDLSDCNLMVLPDVIADLSSLKTLKLCRNNLESLPVTMDRLGCLARLDLEACKRLKSIPELSSIIHIDAHCCTALETISTPKMYGRIVDFRFSDCFRVPQTIFRDIVETHSLDQDNYLRLLCFNMCLPGSEVPEWFNLQGMGCSLSLHVPPDSFNNKLIGFAICIAINFSGARHDVSNIYARCSFTSRRNHGEHFNRFDVLRQSGTQRFSKSDHLFMAYIPLFRYGWITEDELEAIKIVAESGTYSPTEDCVTNRFGVRLIYANHEEMQNSVTPTTVHVDGQSIEDAAQQRQGCSNEGGVRGLGTPFFPDQLEIRKSDTQWEAESSASGEGRGTCQTLELLPEPQKEGEEEEEITMVVEQGKDCRVLGSTCCCFSLSGCTVPLRRKETEREGDRVARIADDGEISKLCSHSGLVVPDSQNEGKDAEEMMVEESLAVRRLLGPLSSCFYWLGNLWHPRIRH